MALLANIALFFVFFLPLTLLVGIPFDFYVGRFQSPDEAFPVFFWVLLGLPLFVPSLLFVPMAHAALAIARRMHRDPSPKMLRRIALVAFPLGMLGVHLLVWGPRMLGAPLLVSFLIPGALFGWSARIPRRGSP